MTQNPKDSPAEKEGLHPRNPHRFQYNFKQLIQSYPALKSFVKLNKYNNESIDFADPSAVKALNKALLIHFYGIANWDIPKNYLCPPIPGRADYIHYLADLLGSCNGNVIPTGKNIQGLDIGVGANCIYPIIGAYEYNWRFVGSDIDLVAINSATQIIKSNDSLRNGIECRLQTSRSDIFKGVIKPGEQFDFSMCNPPFHASLAEAQKGTLRKLNNLGAKKITKPVLNFGGQNAELWCEGGEEGFVRKMIEQSALMPTNVFWFTTLVSKKDNLAGIYKTLKKVKAVAVKTVDMAQGQKVSRIVAWTFLNKTEQKNWQRKRWMEVRNNKY
ncbi:23S rRNA (adenine(1618)-N(6))-methyltransferase RlmF [Solitalea koreensis]|uniref:Ribosomal RNA large subunit methyltransferase F n=1 Tax=Solitalea koreensis TaxID=543615 RepID=A0A521BYV1_9SPHI|nr:23S rRNA (adenine(1618)-N(6))-methyltransferase RlmF [Solitalea koreensis]SMO52378.1 23S rRNA m(6)A-1618 methyltransferase [Solitalea koreensis]